MLGQQNVWLLSSEQKCCVVPNKFGFEQPAKFGWDNNNFLFGGYQSNLNFNRLQSYTIFK